MRCILILLLITSSYLSTLVISQTNYDFGDLEENESGDALIVRWGLSRGTVVFTKKPNSNDIWIKNNVEYKHLIDNEWETVATPFRVYEVDIGFSKGGIELNELMSLNQDFLTITDIPHTYQKVFQNFDGHCGYYAIRALLYGLPGYTDHSIKEFDKSINNKNTKTGQYTLEMLAKFARKSGYDMRSAVIPAANAPDPTLTDKRLVGYIMSRYWKTVPPKIGYEIHHWHGIRHINGHWYNMDSVQKKAKRDEPLTWDQIKTLLAGYKKVSLYSIEMQKQKVGNIQYYQLPQPQQPQQPPPNNYFNIYAMMMTITMTFIASLGIICFFGCIMGMMIGYMFGTKQNKMVQSD